MEDKYNDGTAEEDVGLTRFLLIRVGGSDNVPSIAKKGYKKVKGLEKIGDKDCIREEGGCTSCDAFVPRIATKTKKEQGLESFRDDSRMQEVSVSGCDSDVPSLAKKAKKNKVKGRDKIGDKDHMQVEIGYTGCDRKAQKVKGRESLGDDGRTQEVCFSGCDTDVPILTKKAKKVKGLDKIHDKDHMQEVGCFSCDSFRCDTGVPSMARKAKKVKGRESLGDDGCRQEACFSGCDTVVPSPAKKAKKVKGRDKIGDKDHMLEEVGCSSCDTGIPSMARKAKKVKRCESMGDEGCPQEFGFTSCVTNVTGLAKKAKKVKGCVRDEDRWREVEVDFKPSENPFCRITIKQYYYSWGGLPIPKEFAIKYRLIQRWCEMVLIDPEGRSWPMPLRHSSVAKTKIGRYGGVPYIGNWRNFHEAFGIKIGDVVVLELLEYGEKPIMKFYGGRKKRDEEVLMEQVRFKSSGHPYFRSVIKPWFSKSDAMRIPKHFAEETRLSNRCCDMTLIDQQGKSWPMSLRHSNGIQYTGTCYISGWCQFHEATGLRDGDNVVLELIDSGDHPTMKFYKN